MTDFLHHLFAKTAPLLCTCLVAGSAFAGTVDDTKYSSNLGYAFTPPKDWIRLDASTAKGIDFIPNNLVNTNFSRFDVVYFKGPDGAKPLTLQDDKARADARKEAIQNGERPAPGTPEADEFEKNEQKELNAKKPKKLDFAPSLSVMVIDNLPTKTSTELAKTYANTITNSIKSAFQFKTQNFRITKSTSDRINYMDAFLFRMEYRYNNRDITVDQTVFIKHRKTVIVTCMASDKDYLDGDWCTQISKTFEIDD